MIRARALLAVVLLGCTGPRPPSPRPPSIGQSCNPAASLVTGSGVYGLGIGARDHVVHAGCVVTADSVELDAEAMSQRVMYVALGSDTVRVLVDGGRVTRLELAGSVPGTADGLQVGTRLASARGHLRPALLEGDGRLYALPRRVCGVSFRLSYLPGAEQLSRRPPSLRAIPDSTQVDQILVAGCSDDGAG